MMPRISTTLAAALAISAASAQPPAPITPQQAIDACRALENALERLACYDSIPGASVTGGAAQIPADVIADGIADETTDGTKDATADVLTTLPADASAEDSIDATPGPLFGTAHQTPLARSRMTRRWELDDATHGGLFRVRRHRPVYALPARYSTRPNRQPESPALGPTERRKLDSIEAKFQVSLKTKLADNLVGDNSDVWVGFTQQSSWQAYNSDDSAPFRETNYSPEIWTTWRTGLNLPGVRWQMVNLGFMHQSNGQSEPESRSWNRIYAQFGFERGNWEFYLRPWLRVEAPGDDDNPDIEDYLGHGDFKAIWRGGSHDVALTARYAAGHGRGALQLDWHYPLVGDLKAYLQLFTGYGESLIDYNHRQTTIGLGVSLVQ